MNVENIFKELSGGLVLMVKEEKSATISKNICDYFKTSENEFDREKHVFSSAGN